MQATSAVPGTTGGQREYLKDVLTILEPEETPYTSLVTKGETPAATYIEVLSSSLRKPRTSGTREGLDAGKGNNKAKNRKRFGSYLHRVQDEFGCSDVQQAVSAAGGVAAVNNEYEADKTQTMREIKRDIESVCCSNNEHVSGAGGDADMVTRGIAVWLDKQGGTLQTLNPLPTEFLLVDQAVATDGVGQYKGGVTAVTEDQFNIALQGLNRVYGGKREYNVIAGDIITKVIDNFTRVNSNTTNARYQVRENADDHEITLMVKIFDSTFGRAHIIPSQFNKVNSSGLGDPYTAYILNMDLWEVDFLENLHAEDMPPTSGGRTGYVKAIFANLCKMPKGNGIIFNT